MFSTNPFIIDDFITAGGPVLVVILLATLAMWFFIAERYLFYYTYTNPEDTNFLSTNDAKWTQVSLYKHSLSQQKLRLEKHLTYIKSLISITPLLGLLGTVTGMIEVFDSLNYFGSGNPRAMATGIAKATIPTMAGMVASISGIYFNHQLKRLADQRLARFDSRLKQSPQ